MSSPETAAAAFQVLLDTVENLQVTKYTYVASMTLMVLDIILTFDQEVARVWKSRRSLGKYLFFINRYIPPILFSFDLVYQLSPNPSVTFCKHAFMPPNVLGILSLSIVEFILVLRTHALCQNYPILATLVVLCMAAMTAMIGTTAYMLKHYIQFVPTSSLPGVVGCLPECTAPICRKLLTAFWIPFFVCETLIFMLTLWKLYSQLSDFEPKFEGFHLPKISVIIFRDGFIFYIVIMAISVANLVIWTVAPISLAYLATSLMRSLQVTVCSRLLLNIRGILDPNYGTKAGTVSTFKAQAPGGMQRGPPPSSSTEDNSYLFSTIVSHNS